MIDLRPKLALLAEIEAAATRSLIDLNKSSGADYWHAARVELDCIERAARLRREIQREFADAVAKLGEQAGIAPEKIAVALEI